MARLTMRVATAHETSTCAEHQTFEEIYRDHSAAVFNYAARLCGATLAADVAQDVFLRVWSGRAVFDSTRGSMHSLLLTMTHHRAIDLLRSRNARHRREDLAGSPMVSDEIDAAVLRDERNVGIDAALAGLRVEARDPIVMAIYGQMSYREVAVALDLPEGTVKSRIRAGLQQLHRVLAAPPSGSAVALVERDPSLRARCGCSSRTT